MCGSGKSAVLFQIIVRPGPSLVKISFCQTKDETDDSGKSG